MLNYIQVSSYYKMRSQFFVPRPSIEGSTGPNYMKFCMELSKGITRVTIEGFFDIRSRGPVMGYPWGPIGGPKILKIFFDFFLLFPTGIAFRRVKSLEKMINNALFVHNHI